MWLVGNFWVAYDDWPAATDVKLYLADGGRLSRENNGSGEDKFTYDPNDPVPTIGGNNLGTNKPINTNLKSNTFLLTYRITHL